MVNSVGIVGFLLAVNSIDFWGVKPCNFEAEGKMVEEAGSELVAVACEHLYKVKQALLSRSNMDKILKDLTPIETLITTENPLNFIWGLDANSKQSMW
jgi:hypothetical protein